MNFMSETSAKYREQEEKDTNKINAIIKQKRNK